LSRRDKKGYLLKEDISSPDFDPGKYGKSMDELMNSIHGIYPDGRMISGVDVFIEVYRTVGLGWIWVPTKLPLIKGLYSFAYRWFAKHRLGFGKLLGRKCPNEKCSIHKNTS
jgi:predicted DCC family thiol-disulfide oxidoreductase YuxK